MKNVLVLGAGLVARPLVSYLLARTRCRIVLASRTVGKVERMLDGHPRGVPVALDLRDRTALEDLIKEASLVVSMVPFAFHVPVAELAIRHKVPMVTTSYVSPEMRALDEVARSAGIPILNEMGLDPGIDHMSAMQVIDRVTSTGGKIAQFASCCGGLPAPEANTNPWGYKFSWSPRAAILAGRNPARYLRGGEAVDVPGPAIFAHRWPYEVEDVGLFETYPNRDSLGYLDAYRIPDARNMFRGTIRNPGWCETLQAIAELGILDDAERHWENGTTYGDFLGSHLPDGNGALLDRLADRLGMSPDDEVIARLEWAGFLSERPLPEVTASPMDVLVHRLTQRMSYGPGERDMIILRHEFLAEWPDRPDETIIALLVAYGDPDGDSSMAKTVSLPAAVAARLLVEGELEIEGVHIPVLPEIYVPVLAELEKEGIRFREWSRRILPGPFDPA